MWDFKPVDDLSTVPEQFRGLYNAEKGADGKFTVSAAAQPLVTAYVGETTALAKARKDLKASNDESAARRVTKTAVVDFAKKLGLENINEENPLENIETHIGELLGKVKGGPDLMKSIEKIKTDYERKNTEVVTTADAKVVKMLTSLQKHLVGEAAASAIAAQKGDPKLLRPFVEKYVKVVQEGEDYVVRVVDDAGDIRSNGAGGWMGVADKVTEMKSDASYARLFDSEVKGGGGHPPGSGGKPPVKPAGAERTSIDKITSGLSKGLHTKAPA